LLHRAFTGDLTTQWREAHMKELLAEIRFEQSSKDLELIKPLFHTPLVCNGGAFVGRPDYMTVFAGLPRHGKR
jgi:hypothetical protein